MSDLESLVFYSSASKCIKPLPPGTYGLSNASLDTPWPKVERGKRAFQSIVTENNLDIEKLFTLLKDDQKAEDKELPNTGVGLEWERILSSVFISSPNYGTRSSTVLTVTYENTFQLIERTYHEDCQEWTEVSYFWTIDT